MANFLIHLILIFFVCYAVISFSQELYSKFDHSKLPSTQLQEDASVVDFKSEKVQYLKNGAKYKTHVYFSDGFEYVTFRTNRTSPHWYSYQISIDKELANSIIEKAIQAHEKAYAKQNKL